MAGDWKPYVIEVNTLDSGFKAYLKKAGAVGQRNVDKSTADFKAKAAMGLQLLNFCVNGSSKERVKPPIRWGILRASGSVFADGVLLGDTKALSADGKPATDYSSCPPSCVAVGFNTSYASRLHESDAWTPGGDPPSEQAMRNPAMLENVGNKWVEKHLIADKETLLALYAAKLKEATGA